MTFISQLGLALVLSFAIAALAYWRGSLSQSGALSALLIGTAIFGFGSWVWGIILGLFFVSSSLLSHFKENEKKLAAEKFEKGHKRDAGQVFANGGLGAIIALCSFFFPHGGWFPLFIGVMATVTADTWATELGTLSKHPPRLITSGKVVEVGTSGGITLLGTAVSLSGGLLIGLTAGLLSGSNWIQLLAVGGIGGLSGSLIDSFLGATVQAVYYSEQKQKETEKKLDSQGNPHRFLRGWSWISNDLVNFFASILGGLISLLFYSIWITL